MKLYLILLLTTLIALASCSGGISTRGGKVVEFTLPKATLEASVHRVAALGKKRGGGHVLWAGHDVKIKVSGGEKTSTLSVMVDGPWHISDDIVIRVHEDLTSQGLITGAEENIQASRKSLAGRERNSPLVKTLRELREKGLPPTVDTVTDGGLGG